MYAIEEDTRRQEPVALNVADPARSFEFYQDLFGLVMNESATTGVNRLLETPGDPSGIALLLRSSGDEGAPLWLSVEVGSVSEVLDLYLLAIMMGARALLPRKRGARWTTVVTDPDGNRISVWTKVNDEEAKPDLTMRPQRWEWNLSPRTGEQQDAEERTWNREMSRRSMMDLETELPGRNAVGADRVNRRQGVSGGAGNSPASGCDPMLEGKE